jgi:hypothetical protein
MVSDLVAGFISFIVYRYEMKDLKLKIPAKLDLAN